MYQINTLYTLNNVMCQFDLNKNNKIHSHPPKKNKTKQNCDLGKAIFIALPNLWKDPSPTLNYYGMPH